MYLKTDNEELIELYRALKTNGDINGFIIVCDYDILFLLSNMEYGVDDISDLNDILQDTTLDAYLDIKYHSITVEMEHKMMTGDYEGMVI